MLWNMVIYCSACLQLWREVGRDIANFYDFKTFITYYQHQQSMSYLQIYGQVFQFCTTALMKADDPNTTSTLFLLQQKSKQEAFTIWQRVASTPGASS